MFINDGRHYFNASDYQANNHTFCSQFRSRRNINHASLFVAIAKVHLYCAAHKVYPFNYYDRRSKEMGLASINYLERVCDIRNSELMAK